jgi:hypothetical protein
MIDATPARDDRSVPGIGRLGAYSSPSAIFQDLAVFIRKGPGEGAVFGIQLKNWVWALIIVFIVVLWTDHGDALWIASSVWHGIGHVISALDHGLTGLHTH